MRHGLALIAGVLLALLFMSSVPVDAQATDTPTPTATFTPVYGAIASPPSCGLPFNPCGPLPFPVPRFPTLRFPSPTLRPTVPSPTPIPHTATPSDTPTPTATYTPTETPTGFVASLTPTATVGDGYEPIATISDQILGISQTLIAQASAQVVIDGTPQGPAQIANELGNATGVLFSVARMIGENFGLAGAAVNFLIFALAFVVMVYVATFIGPILLSLARIILQLIQAVKPF